MPLLLLASLIAGIIPAHSAEKPPLKLTSEVVTSAAAKMDTLVEAGLSKAGAKMNAPASDEVFLRRVYLDIAGRIPSAQEVAAFVSSSAPDKRARLIDELLLSPGYRSQMFDWLADMLRIKDKYAGGSYLYQKWIKDQLAANLPWNQFVTELLTAEGSMASDGRVGYLQRDRGMPLDGLSITLTTMLGANIACAQCHDHPFAKWTQKQFYEMASFFGATEVNHDNPRRMGKKLATDDFTKRQLVNLILPNSAAVKTLKEQTLVFPDDYHYSNAKPGSKVTPGFIAWPEQKPPPTIKPDTKQPQTLRRQFVTWMTSPQNPRFATSIANRLWQKNFGLAVKEPVADLDDLSTSSNPALLEYLTRVMVWVKFDLREFQRILCNTRAYQAAANPTPELSAGPYLFAGPVLRRMTAEQAWDSVLTLVVGTEVDQFHSDRSAEVTRYLIPGGELSKEAIYATAAKLYKSSDAPKVGKKKIKKAAASEDSDEAEMNIPKFGKLPLARASELEQPARAEHFLRMFGQSERTLADDSSREGGIPQVLNLMNGEVQHVLTNPKSLLMRDLIARGSASEKMEALYRAFYSRKPTPTETTRIQKALSDGLSVHEVMWALFNSPEFLFVQ